MTDFAEMNCMTMYEYRIRAKAYKLKRVDREHDMHLQAWLNLTAQSTKKSGKKVISVYKNFKDFFDYDKALGRDCGQQQEENRNRGIAELLKKQRERGGSIGKL